MFITYRRQIISVQKLRMTFTDNSYLPEILNKKKRGGARAVRELIFMKGGGNYHLQMIVFRQGLLGK